MFASAPAVQGPVNIADRLYFRKAIETRGFVVGEPVLGRISNKYSINLALPILDDQGQAPGGPHRQPGFALAGKPVGQKRFSARHRYGFDRCHREGSFPLSRTPEIHRQNAAGGAHPGHGRRQRRGGGGDGIARRGSASSPSPGCRLPGRSCGWPSVSPGNGRLTRLIVTCGATSSGWRRWR